MLIWMNNVKNPVHIAIISGFKKTRKIPMWFKMCTRKEDASTTKDENFAWKQCNMFHFVNEANQAHSGERA